MTDGYSIPENKIYSVYVHRNTKNSKVYVGITTNIHDRWDGQRCAAFNKNHEYYDYPLYRAIRKYGWEAFTHDVIEIHYVKQDGLEAEKFWIKQFKSNIRVFGPDYGYNLSSGGEDISVRGWEVRERLSKRMSGINNPHFGKKKSAEAIAKMTKTKRERPMPEKRRQELSDLYKLKFSDEQIRSICSDTRSQSEIAKSYGVSRTAIKRVLTENGVHDSPHKKILKQITKEELVEALKKDLFCRDTAKMLNISTISLYRKIKSLLGADGFTEAIEFVKNSCC